jgi:hypothetical protein
LFATFRTGNNRHQLFLRGPNSFIRVELIVLLLMFLGEIEFAVSGQVSILDRTGEAACLIWSRLLLPLGNTPARTPKDNGWPHNGDEEAAVQWAANPLAGAELAGHVAFWTLGRGTCEIWTRVILCNCRV